MSKGEPTSINDSVIYVIVVQSICDMSTTGCTNYSLCGIFIFLLDTQQQKTTTASINIPRIFPKKISRKLPEFQFGLDPWSQTQKRYRAVNLQKQNAYCHQSRNWARITWHQCTAVSAGDTSALNHECCSSSRGSIYCDSIWTVS